MFDEIFLLIAQHDADWLTAIIKTNMIFSLLMFFLLVMLAIRERLLLYRVEVLEQQLQQPKKLSITLPADDPCPGCGCLPGEGKTPGCQHPLGCGYKP